MVYHDAGETYYSILPTTLRSWKHQPKKRVILVSIVLSVMLLFSQIFRAVQMQHPPHLSNVHLMQSLEHIEVEAPGCVKTYLGTSNHQRSENLDSCHHLPAPRGLCTLTQKLFFSEKPKTCHHQNQVTFCESDGLDIKCKVPSECTTLYHFLGTFNEEAGEGIKWVEVQSHKLELAVSSIFKQNYHKGFVFIQCTKDSKMNEDLGQPQFDENVLSDQLNSHTQLFIYPHKFEATEHVSNIKKNHVNINIIFVDSLSRSHFYRSLPKTITLFERMIKDSKPELLDFQYVQAVKSRTYESLEALFSGYVNVSETPFGTYDIPKIPLPIHSLFRKLKNRGYRTLWLEDLCFTWEWGLVKDLKVVKDSLYGKELWDEFMKVVALNGIDDIDLTLASCEILKANGKKDPFRGVPAVCYNGKYHHEYLLAYAQLYHLEAQRTGKKIISFTQTNVAHDESGIRVQSLDEHLMNYVKFSRKQKNTITIIFSDHGSTYGRFIQSSPEAHIETYNPFLFMIIPSNVRNIIGDVHYRFLKDNQHKLVSLLDVHNMLLTLIHEKNTVLDENFVNKYVLPKGLFGHIPDNRTCNDIPLLQPNLCICKNFDTIVKPTDYHFILADFGVNVLNNVISHQFLKGGGKGGFGSCRPLKAVFVRRARESRVTAELTRVKLDVVVQRLNHIQQIVSEENKSYDDVFAEDLFFLTIEVGSGNPSLRLVSYERLSVYQVYGQCTDIEVELKLCICEAVKQKDSSFFNLIFNYLVPSFNLYPSSDHQYSNIQLINLLTTNVFEMKPYVNYVYPKENPCLFTIMHNYTLGVILKAVNLCSVMHKVQLIVKTENLYLSSDTKGSYLLRPGDIKLLIGGVASNGKKDWDWTYDIQVF